MAATVEWRMGVQVDGDGQSSKCNEYENEEAVGCRQRSVGMRAREGRQGRANIGVVIHLGKSHESLGMRTGHVRQ